MKKIMNRIGSCKRAMGRISSDLRDCTSGVAMVEFAFSAPIVLSLGLMGTETANFTIMHMMISQVAMQVADNTSRVGETDVLVARKVYERNINEAFVGAEKLGAPYAIFENGRIVVSSLQMNSDGGQWIAWQRCRGAKNFQSECGTQGTGASGTSFLGMGSPRIRASSGTAVMFVEVSYTYEPITPIDFFGPTEIEYTAAFNIRDSRDLTQLYQTNPASPVASCNVYSADRPS